MVHHVRPSVSVHGERTGPGARASDAHTTTHGRSRHLRGKKENGGATTGPAGKAAASAAVRHATRNPGSPVSEAIQVGEDRHPPSPPFRARESVRTKLGPRGFIGQEPSGGTSAEPPSPRPAHAMRPRRSAGQEPAPSRRRRRRRGSERERGPWSAARSGAGRHAPWPTPSVTPPVPASATRKETAPRPGASPPRPGAEAAHRRARDAAPPSPASTVRPRGPRPTEGPRRRRGSSPGGSAGWATACRSRAGAGRRSRGGRPPSCPARPGPSP